jgi:hypothetical protein
MSCSNNHRIARSGAATLSSTYGIYNGFDLLEHDPIAGREEYLDSEKYQIKVRDWEKPGNIKPYIRDLNRARRANAALQQTSNLRFIPIEDGNVIPNIPGLPTALSAVSPTAGNGIFGCGDGRLKSA